MARRVHLQIDAASVALPPPRPGRCTFFVRAVSVFSARGTPFARVRRDDAETLVRSLACCRRFRAAGRRLRRHALRLQYAANAGVRRRRRGRRRAHLRGARAGANDLPIGDAPPLRVAAERLRKPVRCPRQPSREQREGAELAKRHGIHPVPRELPPSARRLRARGRSTVPRAVQLTAARVQTELKQEPTNGKRP
jgi:hypothetical protein